MHLWADSGVAIAVVVVGVVVGVGGVSLNESEGWCAKTRILRSSDGQAFGEEVEASCRYLRKEGCASLFLFEHNTEQLTANFRSVVHTDEVTLHHVRGCVELLRARRALATAVGHEFRDALAAEHMAARLEARTDLVPLSIATAAAAAAAAAAARKKGGREGHTR